MVRNYQHTDVLVVGAGPVGLFAALLLAERGVGVRIIDEQWRPGAHSYALALHPHSLELLEQVNLTPELLRMGERISTVGYYGGGELRATLDFGALPGRYGFVLAVPQSILEELLSRRLRERGVEVEWEHKLSHLNEQYDHVLSTIEEMGRETLGYATAESEWVTEGVEHLETTFVLGADGQRSKVRRELDIPFDEVDAPEFYALYEFITEQDLPEDLRHEARIVLDNGLANVFWPLGPRHGRWSFQMTGVDIPRESHLKSRMAIQVGSQIYPYLTEEKLTAFLAERAPWFKVQMEEITWSMGVRFERRLAQSLGVRRSWVAGDAAHVTGPVGVQSMNSGLGEADELARRMARVVHSNGSLDQLGQYGQETLGQWRQMLGIEHPPTVMEGCSPWVAAELPRIVPTLPGTGAALGMLARQLHVHVEGGAGVRAGE